MKKLTSIVSRAIFYSVLVVGTLGWYNAEYHILGEKEEPETIARFTDLDGERVELQKQRYKLAPSNYSFIVNGMPSDEKEFAGKDGREYRVYDGFLNFGSDNCFEIK